MVLHFKEGKTGSYAKSTLSALFHLIRHFIEDFPDTIDLPLEEACAEDFERVLDAYQNYYRNELLVRLTEN